MKSAISRRNLLRRTSLGCGLAVLTGTGGSSVAIAGPQPRDREKRLPREVWIATISQNRMEAENHKQMIRKMLSRMEQVVSYQPDIICLPEVFPFVNTSSGRPPLSEAAEVPIGEISGPFAEFARRHGCYVVCPIYTKSDGLYYNSAVFINPEGKSLGEYHKIHPTIGEMDNGVTPGQVQPPVSRHRSES